LSKIAMLIDSMYGGGAEKVVLTLRRALAAAGHDAHVIALEAAAHYDLTQERNVHFLHSPTRRTGGGRAYGPQARELRELLARLEQVDGKPFDLVVAHLINAQHVAARAELDKTWYCVHASIDGALRQTLRRNPLQYLRQRRQQRVLCGKRVVTVSRGLERELREAGWLHPLALRTIYNPVELGVIRRLAAAGDEPLPPGPYLLHVGRASRQKRLDVLFEALRGAATDLPLVMLTNHPDKVARLARRHGVGARVQAVAFRQNPYPWMARARLMLLSSDYEGFPMVLVEALACGTAVVSTDCPHGPAEILTGPLARWLVPVRDAPAMARKIDEALGSRIDAGAAPVLAALDPAAIAREYAALATLAD
jgi:glycosyltransferase involved in cell wall biosynthesis